MKILGIETVTKLGTIALVENGNILKTVTIDTQLRHTANFVVSLDNLLKSTSTTMDEVDAITVDTGPGSFTGIRVGIASAKGLALCDDKPLIGVCSLDVLCQKMLKDGAPKMGYIIPVIDAKREMVYCAVYDTMGARVREPHLTTMDEILKEYGSAGLVFGPETNGLYPDAGTVAMIGYEKMLNKNYSGTVEPMYLYEVVT